MYDSGFTGTLIAPFTTEGKIINAVEGYKHYNADDYMRKVYEEDPCVRAVGPERTYFVLPMPSLDNVNWFRIDSYLNRYCTNNAPGVAMMEDKFKAYTSVAEFDVSGNNGCYICSQNSNVYTSKRDFLADVGRLLNGNNVVCVQST